jgi:hypothetical protein
MAKETKAPKLDARKFALAAGIYFGSAGALLTAAGLAGVPGFAEFARLLAVFYGPWGYSISLPGILVGAAYGFAEGFIHLGIFGWLYNKLLG